MVTQAVDAAKGSLSIRRACEVAGVSRSSYYAGRFQRKGRVIEPALAKAARALHEQSRRYQGSRQLSANLRLHGFHVGRCRAGTLIKCLGLTRRRRPYAHYRRATKPAVVAPNHLDRQFDPAQPNRCWAGDITQIRIGRRWWYVAVVMDLFSRRIIGWATGTMAGSYLAEEALKLAVAHRQPEGELMFHSDQGCQYSAQRFVDCLAECSIQQSMSRRGNCWDNAVVERFFRTLKDEWVPTAGYTSVDEANKDFARFLIYYDQQRPHSRLNNLPPALFERLAT